MVSLHHLPMRRVVSGSTRAMMSTIAPPSQMDNVPTSSGVKPIKVPAACKMAQMSVVI